MFKERKILELGIGRGGRFVNNDQKFYCRIGLDKNRRRLTTAQNKYPRLSLIESNLNNMTSPTIPFARDSFGFVELRFPHNELFYWLTCEAPNLWHEFSRVLVVNGIVVVIFDVPEGGRMLKLYGKQDLINIEQPEEDMQRRAKDAGFIISVGDFSKQEAYDEGTDYSRAAANWIKKSNGKHKAYVMQAQLLSKPYFYI